MTILMVHNVRLSETSQHDADRVVWWLARQLCNMGHNVRFLAKKGSVCHFATVIPMDDKKTIREQIPPDTDILHLHAQPVEDLSDIPHVVTQHDFLPTDVQPSPHTVFVSAYQAARYDSTEYIHYGLDFSEYGTPNLAQKRQYFHFMGNVTQIGRNIRSALDFALKLGARLHVIGGNRVNFRQKLRVVLSPSVRFHGMLLPDGRNAILNGSKGLVYPHAEGEVFPLSVIESLWFGCPVFGTPEGVLLEILGKQHRHGHRPVGGTVDALYVDFALLSTKKAELLEALKNAEDFEPQQAHNFAKTNYDIAQMAAAYLQVYTSKIHP
jgi:glycosyltransferase involved in cell wall biosynthesis